MSPDAFDDLLRSLPVWDRELPRFAPDTAPEEPVALFRQWLADSAAAGQPEPHTMTLATADEHGDPSVRTVMLHGADADGWHFASDRRSRKGRELAARPHAALHFYWAAVGRQVRVSGAVRAASPRESAEDLDRASPAARAAALVGRQSEPLASAAELARALDAARERVRREPDVAVPDHTRYTLVPDEAEFFQGDAGRRHVRLLYRLGPDGWVRGLLWP
jgi:pyridoxamine 5'-phosphate oxidase